MHVPQFMPWVDQLEAKAIASCIKSTWVTEGPLSRKFCEKMLTLINARYGVFAPNGTLALFLGLKALGLGPGDEVIVPDFTFIASATAVAMIGAKPVFIDVNRRNFQIDMANAPKLVTPQTRAIMPVHIYGTVADMKPVMAFARKHKLKVIEDAAQAIAVKRVGKHAGTFGDVGCFSFFADKTITTAEGGFIVTNHKRIYDSLLYLRNQGRRDRGSFIHPQIGFNFRMTDIQMAMGLAQLKKLPEIIRRKTNILALYKKLLQDLPLVFFEPDPGADWIPFRVGILTPHAHRLMKFMQQKRVEPRTFFYPLHRQPAFTYLKKDSRLAFADKYFPNSIYGYTHGICLPTFPTLTQIQIRYVARVIRDYFYDHK